MTDEKLQVKRIIRGRGKKKRNLPTDLIYAGSLLLLALICFFFLRPAATETFGFGLSGVIGAGYQEPPPTSSPSPSLPPTITATTTSLNPSSNPSAALTPTQTTTASTIASNSSPVPSPSESSSESGSPSSSSSESPSAFPSPTATESPPPSPTPTVIASGVFIAIIIDDIGYNYDREIQALIASPYAITLAILPEVGYGPQIAKDAEDRGKEVIMHLPMEKALDMPGTIYTWMGEQQIRDLLAADINDVPGAVGINNHMGVNGTADPATMRVVMSFVRERGLFFVDSKVTGNSVVSQMAAEQGMPALVRDVFLDGEEGHDYIRGALHHLRGVALEKGFAIGIGHIKSEGITNLISEAAAAWVAEGIQLVPVSHLLRFVGG